MTKNGMAANLILTCPSCGALLQDDLFCPTCREPAGRIIDGIPCFTDPDYYWGEISKSDMQTTNERAQSVGWEKALRERIQDEDFLEYVCSPSRADFQYLWNLPENATVLDVGAGLGAITASLCVRFSNVVAVEGVLERARFVRIRMEQLHRPGVSVICADLLRMPFAPGQFQAVVLNGVLEWSAMTSMDPPRQTQLNFLRRIHELLTPGGLVCIGIENRFGWAMIRGAKDHSGLPYTSLVPRFLANWICRTWSGGYRATANVGYRTYTYSLHGYHRLLEEAGFTSIRSYHAWEGYNMPKTLIPLENSKAILWFITHVAGPSFHSVKRKAMILCARLGLWPFFASDFVLIADKR